MASSLLSARAHSLAPILLSLLATACSEPELVRRDVLLITIDTLRPDFLGAYGHPRASSPNLDELAAEGALYERAYATSPMTGPSHSTMLTGLLTAEHGVVRNGRGLDEAVPNLPEQFRRAGYDTGAVIGSHILHSRFGYARGFDHFDDAFGSFRKNQERPAEEVVASALDWLGERGAEPVFLWVHVYDPHAPYESPAPNADWERSAREHFDARLLALGLEDDAELRELWPAYEREVLRTDAALAPLLEAWDGRGRDSVVCVTSDHGEGLGEHGYLHHGRELWEEQLRVPLILRSPGISSGTRVAASVSLQDLGASLLQHALPGLSPPLPGRPFPTQTGAAARRKLLSAERPLVHGDSTGARAAVGNPEDLEAQLALISPPHKYIWRESRAALLFDLSQDAEEHDDLAASSPDELARFERLRARHLGELRMVGAGKDHEDAETRALLDALGYD